MKINREQWDYLHQRLDGISASLACLEVAISQLSRPSRRPKNAIRVAAGKQAWANRHRLVDLVEERRDGMVAESPDKVD